MMIFGVLVALINLGAVVYSKDPIGKTLGVVGLICVLIIPVAEILQVLL